MTTSQVVARDLLEEAGLTFVTGVPDSVFKGFIADLERDVLDDAYLLATREDNAIALAVGAYLAGERPLVFMESAGFGTALDALTSLAIVYRIPLVLLIAWAGYKGRDVPHHNSIGSSLDKLLDAIDLPRTTVHESDMDGPGLRDALAWAGAQTETTGGPAVVLVVPEELRDPKDGGP